MENKKTVDKRKFFKYNIIGQLDELTIFQERSAPYDEKAQTCLSYRLCAYHEREFLPRREALSHFHFTVRMTGFAEDTVMRIFLLAQFPRVNCHSKNE